MASTVAPAWPQALHAPDFEPFEGSTVTRIELTGHRVTKEHIIERELQTRVGEPFHLETLEADLTRLESLNTFASVHVTPKAVDGGIEFHFGAWSKISAQRFRVR